MTPEFCKNLMSKVFLAHNAFLWRSVSIDISFQNLNRIQFCSSVRSIVRFWQYLTFSPLLPPSSIIVRQQRNLQKYVLLALKPEMEESVLSIFPASWFMKIEPDALPLLKWNRWKEDDFELRLMTQKSPPPFSEILLDWFNKIYLSTNQRLLLTNEKLL